MRTQALVAAGHLLHGDAVAVSLAFGRCLGRRHQPVRFGARHLTGVGRRIVADDVNPS